MKYNTIPEKMAKAIAPMALARAIFETIMFLVGGAGGVAVSCCG